MGLELLYYIFFCLLGFYFAIVRVSSVQYSLLSFFALFFLSITVRYSGFDRDIVEYANSFGRLSLSIYYLKEPLFWLGSRGLYFFIKSEVWVFVFFDLISFFLLFKACRIGLLPRYFPYMWLCFFPSVMGFQNVYRQYLTCNALLLFFVYVFADAKASKSFFALLVSGLSHNVGLLFSHLFFSIKSKLLVVLCSIGVFVLLPIVKQTKSNSDTGLIGAEIYVFALSLLLLIYLLITKCKWVGKEKAFFLILCFFFVLSFESYFILGGAQSKRIGMICLILSLFPLARLIEERVKPVVLGRAFLFFFAVFPTFIFTSSFELLLGQN